MAQLAAKWSSSGASDMKVGSTRSQLRSYNKTKYHCHKSQIPWPKNCWLEYNSVPCASFLSKLRRVCLDLNVVWTLHIARKHMDCLRSTNNSTHQIGVKHKKVATPRTESKIRNKRVGFKANHSHHVCKNRFKYKNRFNLPTCLHFFQRTMCNMEPSRGFWHKIRKLKKGTVSVSKQNFQQRPSPIHGKSGKRTVDD